MIVKTSAWDRQGIDEFLEAQTIPVRLACLTSRSTPVVCSLWYLWEDGALWCATQASARVVDYLSAHPDCGFEVAPDLPRDVDSFLAIALAKKPDDRFQTARDFAAAFRDATRNQLDTGLRRRARSLLQERPWGRRASEPGGRKDA